MNHHPIRTLMGVTLLISLLTIGGCIVCDQLTTVAIHPDGSAYFLVVESNVHSNRTGTEAEQDLKQYVDAFGGGIVGLTGSEEAMAPLLSSLGVVHAIQPLAGDDYTVDHSATIYYLNAQGDFAAVFTPPFSYPGMRADLVTLLTSNN